MLVLGWLAALVVVVAATVVLTMGTEMDFCNTLVPEVVLLAVDTNITYEWKKNFFRNFARHFDLFLCSHIAGLFVIIIIIIIIFIYKAHSVIDIKAASQCAAQSPIKQ